MGRGGQCGGGGGGGGGGANVSNHSVSSSCLVYSPDVSDPSPPRLQKHQGAGCPKALFFWNGQGPGINHRKHPSRRSVPNKPYWFLWT